MYLYAVLPAAPETERGLGKIAGIDPAEPLFSIDAEGLTAAVSRVPAEQFEEAPLNEMLSDLARRAPYAVRHEEAIRGLTALGSSLAPAAFGRVYRGEDGVRAMLRAESERLRLLLEELEGKEEWGLKVTKDAARLWAAALEHVGDPIIVTDAANEIMLMNHSAEWLLKPGAIPDASQASVYVANDTKLNSFLSQLRLEPGAVRRSELELVHPETHEPLPMGITSTEVQDEVGRTSAIVSVLHDLTAIYELERKNVEQQLFESEKLAAVGRLAAAVAHEVNNPLEAIKNSLYLVLSSTSETDPNRRFLEIAGRETERVAGIVRQMLGFYSRATDRVPTSVNKLLEEAVELVERDLARQRIRIRRDLDDKIPEIPATPDQLKQVFLNLFLNAKEAMPDGGELRVSTRLAGPRELEMLTGRHVLVQVQDSGTGIAREHMRHLFEPFFSTKQAAKGTGLGLWVSQSIVQQHGGQIQVTSRQGLGTTFSVALPLEAMEPSPAPVTV